MFLISDTLRYSGFLTAVLMILLLWNVTACQLVNIYDVSKDLNASIFRVRLFKNYFTLKMETLVSSERCVNIYQNDVTSWIDSVFSEIFYLLQITSVQGRDNVGFIMFCEFFLAMLSAP